MVKEWVDGMLDRWAKQKMLFLAVWLLIVVVELIWMGDDLRQCQGGRLLSWGFSSSVVSISLSLPTGYNRLLYFPPRQPPSFPSRFPILRTLRPTSLRLISPLTINPAPSLVRDSHFCSLTTGLTLFPLLGLKTLCWFETRNNSVATTLLDIASLDTIPLVTEPSERPP